MKISVIILSKDGEINNLLRKSVAFADEVIIIVDTTERKHVRTRGKTKTFYHPLNGDFSAQRNFGLHQAANDWVLFVDEDEYVGTELKREIKLALKHNPKYCSGYYLPRQDVIFHKPLLHGETGQTKLLRLANRHQGQFIRPVHELWKVSGQTLKLNQPIYHRKDYFISEFVSRLRLYGPIDAQVLTKEGKPFSWFRTITYPSAKFFYNYILKSGLLDGLVGLFIAYLMSAQSLTIRVFQWENLSSLHES